MVKSTEDTYTIVSSILNVFDAGKLSIQLFNLADSSTQGKGETWGEFDNFDCWQLPPSDPFPLLIGE